MTSFLALVLETVDFMSLDGVKAPSPKSGEEVINKFQGQLSRTGFSVPTQNLSLSNQPLISNVMNQNKGLANYGFVSDYITGFYRFCRHWLFAILDSKNAPSNVH